MRKQQRRTQLCTTAPFGGAAASTDSFLPGISLLSFSAALVEGTRRTVA